MKLTKTMMLGLCMVSLIFSQKININEATNPGDQLTIKIKDLKGSIQIEGWDQDRIQIKSTKDPNEVDVRLVKSGTSNKLQVRHNSDYYDDDHLELHLKINVPKRYQIVVRTQTEFTLKNVEGEFDISVANENAIFSNLKGKGDFSVTNGEFEMDNSTLDGEFSNVNGDMTVKKSDLSGFVRTTNANMVLSRAPKGLKAKSTNGNITVDQVMDFVDVRTTNGNLSIGELNGSLEFESTNGSVDVTMVGDANKGNHDIEINTLNGSAEIYMKDNFSMDFDIKIEEKNSYKRRNFTVKTDFEGFDIKTYGKDAEDDDEDYEVIAKGKINTGKHDATLRIVNGNVRIKKVKN